MTTVGILGVGRLAEFLVAGLCRHADAPAILLSPRNAARAARLTTTQNHPGQMTQSGRKVL